MHRILSVLLVGTCAFVLVICAIISWQALEAASPLPNTLEDPVLDGIVRMDGDKPEAPPGDLQLVWVRCRQDGRMHLAVVFDQKPFKPDSHVTLTKEIFAATRK